MSKKITALLKNLSRYWFILSFFAISLAVISISFYNVFELKSFLVELPESCDVDYNTCVKVDEELTPSRFILLEENYFLRNCENKDFNECMEICEADNACETRNNQND